MYSLKNAVLLIFCCVVIMGKSYSQNNPKVFDLKQMLPTSPEAAILGRFGDIPIGYYTGTADISIPVYTIKEAGLEIPIVLRYHGSGIKVEDQASNVGLGWSMEPAGTVIQVVNGVEDYLDDITNADPEGYAFLKDNVPVSDIHYGRSEIGEGLWPCVPDDGLDDSEITVGQTLRGYGQPDIYQYVFPGYSGKFYVHPETKLPVLIDKKAPLTIELINPNSGGNFNSWIFTTIDGHKFYFDVKENSSNQYLEHTGYSWRLSKIELNNKTEILFDYVDGYYQWYTYSESYHTPYRLELTPIDERRQIKSLLLESNHNIKYLTRITTPNEIIDFNLQDREDLIGRPDNDGNPDNGVLSVKSIKSIDIISRSIGLKIRSFAFNYGYFDYDQTGGSFVPVSSNNVDALGKRLKLLSLQETGFDISGKSISKPPYKFEYDEIFKFPLKTSFARDFWGYYNGKASTKMIPDLSFFYFTDQYPDMPYELIEAPFLKGGNRTPDKDKMVVGLLKKITYPTGGYTYFDYQANSFANYDYPDMDKLEEYTKNEFIYDQNEPNNIKSKQILITKTTTIKYRNYISNGNPEYNDPGTMFDDLLSAAITLRKFNGSFSNATVLKEWKLSADDREAFIKDNGVVWEGTFEIAFEEGAQYYIQVEMPDALGSQFGSQKGAIVSSKITYLTASDEYKISYGGGVRVSSVKNFDSNDKILSNKIIEYVNTDDTSSGKLMSGLQYLFSRSMYFSILYNIHEGCHDCQPVYLPKDEDAIIWFISSDSYIPFSNSASGNLIGYSRVEEIELGKNGTENGKHLYYYYNEASNTSLNTPDNPNLLNGFLAREEVKNSSSELLSEITYVYTSKWNHSFQGVKSFDKLVMGYECVPLTGMVPRERDDRYIILYYPINSKWYSLDRKISRQSGVEKIEEYTYNQLGQLVKTSSRGSKNDEIKTEFLYPDDIIAGTVSPTKDGALQNAQLLASNGLRNTLQEQRTFVNDNMASTTVWSYILNPDKSDEVVVRQIDRSYYGKPLVPEVLFDRYGPKKTLKELTIDGLKTALLWSDDYTYIISEIKNSDLKNIAFTSFERNETGNWIVGGSVSLANSYTGRRCLSLSTNQNLNKNDLTASVKYVVSYWTRNASSYNVTGTVGSPTKGKTINGWTYYEHLVTGVTNASISGVGLIDEVRLYPFGAQMATYTRQPLIGVTSSTDPNNVTSYYEYDPLGRLIVNKDNERDIIQHIEYNYQAR